MKHGLITLGLLAGLLLGASIDATQPPSRQITAHIYQAGIDGYRAYIHPVTSRFIRCRFRPTCSNYSSLAVQRFGIAHGLRLTATRLWSCRPSVPLGTVDPVPSH